MLLYEAIGAHDMFKFKEKDILYDLDLPPILLWEDFFPSNYYFSKLNSTFHLQGA